MKLASSAELRIMSGEQLLLCRLRATPAISVEIDRELDRRSLMADVDDIMAGRRESGMRWVETMKFRAN
jgi:hypothetical protein